MLFPIKQKFNWGQIYKEISKISYFKNLEKAFKVVVAEEIGGRNEIVLNKVGWGNEQSLCELYNY